MDRLAPTVPISEAKARLSELVREAEAGHVVLMRHGRPAAVLVSVEQYGQLLEQLDDLEDRLSIHETAGEEAVPLEKLAAELGQAPKRSRRAS